MSKYDMNNIIENTLAVAPVGADNIQNNTSTPVADTKPKGNVGRPRTRLTKEVVFLLLADGSYVRRTKGKPAHDSKAMTYRVPWDYAGTTLPEESQFVEVTAVKDTRKPKAESPAQAEAPAQAESPSESVESLAQTIPATSEILPLV